MSRVDESIRRWKRLAISVYGPTRLESAVTAVTILDKLIPEKAKADIAAFSMSKTGYGWDTYLDFAIAEEAPKPEKPSGPSHEPAGSEWKVDARYSAPRKKSPKKSRKNSPKHLRSRRV